MIFNPYINSGESVKMMSLCSNSHNLFNRNFEQFIIFFYYLISRRFRLLSFKAKFFKFKSNKNLLKKIFDIYSTFFILSASNKKERKVFSMRMSNIKKKALRSVHIREVKLRTFAKKQAKLSGKESEKTRANRVQKLLNEIRKERKV